MLSSNLLDYIPTTTLFDTRATLQLLDMSQNLVTVLPSHGFHGLYGLKTLIISNMPRLEKIEALAFHDLHSLATVGADSKNMFLLITWSTLTYS